MIENHNNESKFLLNKNFTKNSFISKWNNHVKQSSSNISFRPASKTRNNQTMTRSWTDNSFFKNGIDCFLFKYSQLSRSERFLDLLELSNNQESFNNKVNITSIDSLTSSFTPSIDFSKLNDKANRNLPRNFSHEEFLSSLGSSSEESIVDNMEKFPTIDQEIFNCDDGICLKTSESIENIDENNSFNKEIPSLSVPEKNRFNETESNPVKEQKLGYMNKVEEESINNDSNISDSSLMSTTLNESNSSSIENSSCSSPSSQFIELNNDNKKQIEGLPKHIMTNNDINETLSRDMFENDDECTSSPNNSLSSSDDDDLLIRMPKKSCLKKFFNEMNEEFSLIDSSVNATSSPLGSPRSMNSSLQWSSTTTEGASSSQNQSMSSSNTSMRREKKRVSFADVCGKELFTVRTMSEPSNCPPKLTSKIVEYFLNREFTTASSAPDYFNPMTNSFQLPSDYITNCLQKRDPFFSTSRSYDYGINASNYTNDVNQLKGSIAVYSLNFGQPAGDYFKFRNRLEENSVSLENVLLNGFQINGTIKVKNISFEKNVFIRCSFNKWKTYEDYSAVYVPSDFYSSSSSLNSPTSSSGISAAFCGTNNSHYEPQHKEYDTFRFEFKLPKRAEPEIMDKINTQNSNHYKSNITASIQFCVCFQSGPIHSQREYWDSNGGSNYEILQYVIDLERLKPYQNKTTLNKYQQKNKKNYFKYESNYSGSSNNISSLTTGPLDEEIYY